jgi:hypothetical protein
MNIVCPPEPPMHPRLLQPLPMTLCGELMGRCLVS